MGRSPSVEPDGNQLLNRFPREAAQRLRKRIQRVTVDLHK